jgi:hypothetical protein
VTAPSLGEALGACLGYGFGACLGDRAGLVPFPFATTGASSESDSLSESFTAGLAAIYGFFCF